MCSYHHPSSTTGATLVVVVVVVVWKAMPPIYEPSIIELSL